MKKVLILFISIFSLFGEDISGEIGGSGGGSLNTGNINTAKLNTSGSTDMLGSLFVLFNNIANKMFDIIAQGIANVLESSLLTILFSFVILIWAVRRISQADFEIPKDIIQICIFLLVLIGVSYLSKDINRVKELMEYIHIPANLMNEIAVNITAQSHTAYGTQNDSGIGLGHAIQSIWDSSSTIMSVVANSKISIFDGIFFFIQGFYYLLYMLITFLLIVVLSLTYISTYIQISFWKSFALLFLPLLFFKQTRGMFFTWLKAILALTLINSTLGFSAYFAVAINDYIIEGIQSEGAGISILDDLTLASIAMIISIYLVKEVPSFINNILQSQGSGAGSLGGVLMNRMGGAIAGTFGGYFGAKTAKVGEVAMTGAGIVKKGATTALSNITKGANNMVSKNFNKKR